MASVPLKRQLTFWPHLGYGLAVFLCLFEVIVPVWFLVLRASADDNTGRISWAQLPDISRALDTLTHVTRADLFWASVGTTVFGATLCALIATSAAAVFAVILKLAVTARNRRIILWILVTPLFSSFYLRTFAIRNALAAIDLPAILPQWTGIQDIQGLLFSKTGTLVVLCLMSLPYAFIFCVVGVEGIADDEIAAAKNLGVPARTIVENIIIPRSVGAIFAGGMAAFVFSFGDHIVNAVIGGNARYVMPLWAIDLWRDNDYSAAAAIALWQIVILLIPISIIASNILKKIRRP